MIASMAAVPLSAMAWWKRFADNGERTYKQRIIMFLGQLYDSNFKSKKYCVNTCFLFQYLNSFSFFYFFYLLIS